MNKNHRQTAAMKSLSWLPDYYTSTMKSYSKRKPRRGDTHISNCDALEGRFSVEISLEKKCDVLLGILVGDCLGVTSKGLSYTKAGQLCKEKVPWPFTAQGSDDELDPSTLRSTTVLGAQALVALRSIELSDDSNYIKVLTDQLCDSYKQQHYTSFDSRTVSSLGQLTSHNPQLGKAGIHDYIRRPHNTSSDALARCSGLALAPNSKISLITQTVITSIVTHSHPLEVMCAVIYNIILYDAVHLQHNRDVNNTYLELLLLSSDENKSIWCQWKQQITDSDCEAWLSSINHLSQHEKDLYQILRDIPLYNPFRETAPKSVTVCLKTALWALHWSKNGCFPPDISNKWIRSDDYDLPMKYKTRIIKERRMVQAGLLPSIRKDHPGGDIWNVLDVKGKFDSIMWCAIAGGDSIATCMIAGGLLAATHQIDSRWKAEVQLSSLAFELLRRVVGDDNSTTENPSWLTCVTTHYLENNHLTRIASYLLPIPETTKLAADAAAECRGRESAAVMSMMAISRSLPDHVIEKLSKCCCCMYPDKSELIHSTPSNCCYDEIIETHDPLQYLVENPELESPAVVFCANPFDLLGDFEAECCACDENQLLKRTSAILALWQKRNPSDGRQLTNHFMRKEPYWPLSKQGVVYLPHCLICIDQDYNLLQGSKRRCIAVALMSHHRKDDWEIAGIETVVERMRNVFSKLRSEGHKTILLPSFGYNYLEDFSQQQMNSLWVSEASAYSFDRIILFAPSDSIISSSDQPAG